MRSSRLVLALFLAAASWAAGCTTQPILNPPGPPAVAGAPTPTGTKAHTRPQPPGAPTPGGKPSAPPPPQVASPPEPAPELPGTLRFNGKVKAISATGRQITIEHGGTAETYAVAPKISLQSLQVGMTCDFYVSSADKTLVALGFGQGPVTDLPPPGAPTGP